MVEDVPGPEGGHGVDGVYWIPAYDILEASGFEVTLVNARHVKNVSGRKSDVMDCQWIQQLHSFGLLKGAFRPERQIVALRTMVRTRDNLVRDQSHQIQLIQKAYTEMNMPLQNVLSDIGGVSGMAITRAIVKGERDPKKLAALCDVRVQASSEEVAGAFLGEWLPEHIMAMAFPEECATMYCERTVSRAVASTFERTLRIVGSLGGSRTPWWATSGTPDA